MDGSPLRVLVIANNRISSSDYRAVHAKRSRLCTVTLGLPERPQGTPSDQFVRLDFREGISPRDVKLFFGLYRMLSRRPRRWDLVHFYCTKLVLFGPLVSRLAGVPAVVTITGLGRAFSAKGLRGAVARAVYRALFHMVTARFSRVVCFQTPGDMKRLTGQEGGGGGRARLVGSGSEFPLIEDDSLRSRRVLGVSRIMEGKGIEDFVAASRILAEQGVECVLVGPPSQGSESLVELVRAAERDGVLRWPGPLYGEDLVEEFRRASVFLFTSRYPEGVARVLIEAGRGGLVPVAYATPPNRDVIPEDAGVLVRVGDFRELARAVSRLLDDPDEWAAIRDRYRKHVLAEYDMERFVERLDRILVEASGREPVEPDTAPSGSRRYRDGG